ncbi:MAG TPA: FtsX-like permease family protein [Acidimicrobiales bacterium]|nr:FtsX-like permease family protein [Acidimicrobiales bacterium]
MWKVTLKGLLAHKFRLGLTALAIVLGVTFISGTLVLTDTLHNTFTTLFGSIYQHVDFEIRGHAAFADNTGGGGVVRKPIPDSLIAAVRRVPGVAFAEGNASGYAQYIARDGKAVTTGGAPSIGVAFDTNPQLSVLHLVAGVAPKTSHDVLMDAGTARTYHFTVGNHVRMLLAGPPQTFTITGIVMFGSADNLAGATLAAFTLPTAQQLFGKIGHVDAIDIVVASGADKATVEHRIARSLPHGVEVVTGQTVADEQAGAINRALSFFSTALLVFAFIALFVGGFTIFNTFSIIVGQRTRELALLRIVGASRRQVFRSVLLEAALVGLTSSLIGLGLGVLSAKGLEALLGGFGITLPSGPLVFGVRTVAAALLVGVGVTVVSAVSPARRAVRIPPVAAIVSYAGELEVSSRRRITIGGIITVVSIAVLGLGLTLPAIQLVGLGAVGTFIGAGMLAPSIARPIASALGRPLARVLGVSGRLGRENSMRSPRRTAQTSSALMVGLALVSAISVFGASLSKSATSSVNNAINADFIISATGVGAGRFSHAVEATVSKVPGVTATSTVYTGEFEIGHALATLTGISTDHLADTVILRMQAGTGGAALAAGALLIDATTADSKHLSVGSVVPVKFAQTGNATMRIGGIFKANALIGRYVVGDGFFLSHFNDPLPVAVLLRSASGAGGIEHAVARVLHAYPNLQVQTRAQFEKSQEAMVNQLLGLVYALLALAVLIALIGIVNTLMLSVFERTHEIGLLRAVGMKRRQIRAMIRSESVILAVFGAIIGLVIGTALGVALASSLKQQGITDIVVPFSNLVIFLVIAALLGLGAASWPARRAGKLDVLAAIAAE